MTKDRSFPVTFQIAAATLAVVFDLISGAQAQTFKVLYTFTGGSEGGNPNAVLIFDGAGNLYSTTDGGGNLSDCNGGCGVVFELSPTSAATWNERVLHTFTAGLDGAVSVGGLTFDATGNLYGQASFGG